MPKAAKPKKAAAQSKATNPIAKKEKAAKDKDPKPSHLYTDDNPATTLHGTGFKDAQTAHHTIELVSKRSLTYQYQAINTMYNRAKSHPHKTEDIEAAIDVFKTWVKETYPKQKADMRSFKPLLSKKTVDLFLDQLKAAKGVDTEFAEVYVGLEARKRLANTLVDETKPGESDWERTRYDHLCKLVPENGEKTDDADLWDGSGKPSKYHLDLISWAWSPLSERKLLGTVKKG